MHLRSGGPAEPDARPTSLSWRVSPGLVVLKVIGTLVLAAVAVLSENDPRRVFVAGLAAAGLAALAVRDLVAPVRLAADQDGVTVVEGFARRRRLPWSEIEGVRVDERSRYGVRSERLEVDAGEALHVFSATDLGAPVGDVVAALTALRPRGQG